RLGLPRPAPRRHPGRRGRRQARPLVDPLSLLADPLRALRPAARRARPDRRAEPAALRIAAVGRALPPHVYDQATLLAALKKRWSLRHLNLERLERLHKNVLVGGRHLALPIEEYDALTTWGKANDAWIRVAQEVGEQAVRDALARAGAAPPGGRAPLF